MTAMSAEDDPIVEHFFGAPLRRSQVDRERECAEATRQIRQRAAYRSLVDAGPSSGVGVNCARCEFIGDFSDEGQRGICMQRRAMVSTWHNCECAIFVARTSLRASDVLKAELARQEHERGKK